MKFALVNGLKTEAYPKQEGQCPFCGCSVISKCGQFRIWHWAHRRSECCDSWTEPETEWHRSWKDEFPQEWQEVGHTDVSTSERHIADVKTADGLVLEFQHSYIGREEMEARQEFYGRLIWIVDAQPESDSTNAYFFRMGLSGPVCSNPKAYTVCWYSQSKLLHKWGKSETDVYLDFRQPGVLWRLLSFEAKAKEGLVIRVDRSRLIRDCKAGNASLGTRGAKSDTLRKVREVHEQSPARDVDNTRSQRRHGDNGQRKLLFG